MPPYRSPLWRLLPWLLPVALIVVGLIFITASLTGTDRPNNIVAPPNVRDVTTRNADAWAARQVLPGTTTAVTGVIMVSSRSIDVTRSAIRAVIGRVDTAASGGELSTVVTCVKWDVDVGSGVIIEHGTVELSNAAGRHALGDTGSLRRKCAAATFAG